MSILNLNISSVIDNLIKEAEDLANNNLMVGKLLDMAFEKIGEASDKFFIFQNKSNAMMRMLKAWYAKEYTGVSKKAILSLIASLIYFVNPIDLIPDFIPVVGKFDDILILGFITNKLNNEIQKFMAWEEAQQI